MPQQPEACFTIGSMMTSCAGGGLSMGIEERSAGGSVSGVGCADSVPAVASEPISIRAQSVFMPDIAVAKNERITAYSLQLPRQKRPSPVHGEPSRVSGRLPA